LFAAFAGGDHSNGRAFTGLNNPREISSAMDANT
jgi:hypothetical protein